MINPNDNIKCELLYRLSEHGEQYSKFHELCDNQGPLLVLYQIKEGNIIGVYIPLILDKNKDGWQNDMDTFIFDLNQNIKYKKKKSSRSLYYANNHGIYTGDFGNGSFCQSMKKLVYYPDNMSSYYDNGSKILPNKGNKTYYELLEFEVFKVK